MVPRFALVALLIGLSNLDAAAPPADATAAAVDAALAAGPAPRADDAAFLRRVTLDLTGKLPDPATIDKFVADAATDKRAKVIDELLNTDAYAVNWGRYWRDTVTYHTPASANYLRWKLFDEWWTNQFRHNRPWNEVVTTLVTASGVNDELAPVNYLTALYGNPSEIAATTSRVFLGVQIQCAECHDAKGGLPWKRQQFHEFAAFFGRARLIQHKDVDGRGTPYAIESRADGQYRMTDKNDPTHLIDMAPRFFTGESLPLDTDDNERRQLLAKVLTDPKNPWFAKCYVNRMWTALLGWGFYPSVTDLGPTAEPIRHKEALTILTKGWLDSGYDVKWLFRTIARTEAYQSATERTSDGLAIRPTTTVSPVRLRPEQVFEALQKALSFDENDKSIPAPAPGSGPACPRHTGLRHMVYQAFKADPSAPAVEVEGTIPQALLMMNSALVHAYTSASGKTLLAELLDQKKTDAEIVTALYERVLSRKPTTEDLSTCQRYIAKVSDRKEALEDVLWALVNSTEFLLKK